MSNSDHLPSATPVESSSVESVPSSSQGGSAFEKISLKTQQIVIATIVAVIAAMMVLAVISTHTIWRSSGTTLSQVTDMGLAALLTGSAVGVASWLLERMTTNQIKRSIDNLQAQFRAVEQGNLDVQATVYSPHEMGKLASGFNQMIRLLDTRIREFQQKAEEQEKAKEDLQQKLIQSIQSLESFHSDALTVQPEVITSEDHEQAITPPGTLLEFLDNFHKWSRLPTASELLFGSSTLEEIQQRKDALEYRKVWLQALLDETKMEISLISQIGASTEKNTVEIKEE